MPQVSLYLNKKTYTKVRRAAEAESISLSKWVSKKLDQTIAAEWPDGFNELFGCIRDDSFKVPRRETFILDAPRDSL